MEGFPDFSMVLVGGLDDFSLFRLVLAAPILDFKFRAVLSLSNAVGELIFLGTTFCLDGCFDFFMLRPLGVCFSF